MKLYKLYNDIIIEEVSNLKKKLLNEGVLEDLKHAMENTYNVWFKYKTEDGTITDRYVQLDKLGTSLANNEIVRLWQIGGKTTNTKNKITEDEIDDINNIENDLRFNDKTDDESNNTNVTNTNNDIDNTNDINLNNDIDNKNDINLNNNNVNTKKDNIINYDKTNNVGDDKTTKTDFKDKSNYTINKSIDNNKSGNISNKNVWGWKTFRVDRIIPGSIKPTKMKYYKPIKDINSPYNPNGDKLMKGNITVANYKNV